MHDAPWLFAYGSVIYRPGFPFAERHPALLRGYVRRFSQASDDHRGTAALPGRVANLHPRDDATVRGVAYRVEASLVVAVLADLDVREKAGYGPRRVAVALDDGRCVVAVAYIAPPANPWDVGPEPFEATVERILVAAGPSGTNVEYLLRLEEALRALGVDDDPVHDLAERVRRRLGAAPARPR